MPVLNKYNLTGSQTGTIEINENIFGIEPNKTVMHEVLVAELAAVRAGTASTKTRGEVRGGGRKPFKQKGTGRARQGSIRAPHMVGGGVVHGPKPRSYEKKVNKKVRKLAIRSALSAKFSTDSIIILEDYALETPKTKTIVEFEKTLNITNNKVLYVLDWSVEEENLLISARNIPAREFGDPYALRIKELLKSDKVVITLEALNTIKEVLG